MTQFRTALAASLAMLAALAAPAHGASIVNNDGEPRTLIVTENGVQSELVIGAGETRSFCTSGCFITLPNGDRAALIGTERLQIVGGDAVIN
ncbi:MULTISPECIES: hypothetical protein [unclassified Roseitalea]|nr:MULTISPECIES: hypothetical protein [unclassified Roseitalea]